MRLCSDKFLEGGHSHLTTVCDVRLYKLCFVPLFLTVTGVFISSKNSLFLPLP